MDRREINARRKAALEAQGYVGLSVLVKLADIEELREAWGFRTKEEAIRVSLRFLIKATRDGLEKFDV